MGRKRRVPNEELARCVPERSVPAERGDDGRIVLLRQRFSRGPLAWWLQPRLSRPHFRIHLDDIGTFVWDHIDGEATVGDIAAAMEEQLGDRASPALPRLCLFVSELHRGGMVRLLAPEEEPSTGPEAT